MTRAPRPCRLRVVVHATEETGYALVQWADNTYTVKLDDGEWLHDVDAVQLVFVASERRAAVAPL